MKQISTFQEMFEEFETSGKSTMWFIAQGTKGNIIVTLDYEKDLKMPSTKELLKENERSSTC